MQDNFLSSSLGIQDLQIYDSEFLTVYTNNPVVNHSISTIQILLDPKIVYITRISKNLVDVITSLGGLLNVLVIVFRTSISSFAAFIFHKDLISSMFFINEGKKSSYQWNLASYYNKAFEN